MAHTAALRGKSSKYFYIEMWPSDFAALLYIQAVFQKKWN